MTPARTEDSFPGPRASKRWFVAQGLRIAPVLFSIMLLAFVLFLAFTYYTDLRRSAVAYNRWSRNVAPTDEAWQVLRKTALVMSRSTALYRLIFGLLYAFGVWASYWFFASLRDQLLGVLAGMPGEADLKTVGERVTRRAICVLLALCICVFAITLLHFVLYEDQLVTLVEEACAASGPDPEAVVETADLFHTLTSVVRPRVDVVVAGGAVGFLACLVVAQVAGLARAAAQGRSK